MEAHYAYRLGIFSWVLASLVNAAIGRTDPVILVSGMISAAFFGLWLLIVTTPKGGA